MPTAMAHPTWYSKCLSHLLPRRASAALSIFVLALIWTWAYYRPIGGMSSIRAKPSAAHNIDLSDPEAPFIGWPLERVCNEAHWVSGLVYMCDNNSGGPGNIRNYILTCLRYAIESGATGLIMPRIRARSGEDLSSLMGHYQDFDYLFDVGHFRSNLNTYCPQITIYDAPENIPNIPTPVRSPYPIETAFPKDLLNRTHTDWRDQNRQVGRFGIVFREWLDSTAKGRGHPAISVENPRLVRLRWGVLWEWPIYQDGPEFASTFGGLLKIRDDVLQLAKKTVVAMQQFARKHSSQKHAGYLGIHLRSESDALMGWPNYIMQRDAYLAKAKERPFDVAYLASGNATEADKFAADAMTRSGIHVTSKHMLLKDRPELLEQLESLSWDQQALVDFVALLASDFFLGVSPSSFSINVALKRHLDGLYTRPWKIGGKGDGKSWIVGNFENYIINWFFIYDGMWP